MLRDLKVRSNALMRRVSRQNPDRHARRGDDCRDRAADRPIAYAASQLVIVTACLVAAWIPATRAARLDPMRTIRQD